MRQTVINLVEVKIKHSVKYTDGEIRSALIRGGGVIRGAATILDCAPATISHRVNQNDELRQIRDDWRRALVHSAEDALETDFIDNPEIDPRTRLDAIKFVLRTQGRELGWNETSEIALLSKADTINGINVVIMKSKNNGETESAA